LKNVARVLREYYRKWRKNEYFDGGFISPNSDIVKNLWTPIKECFKDKNTTLEQRVGLSLEKLKEQCGFSDWVYMTRIDSDDCFHKDAINLIQSQPSFRGAYMFERGLIYHEKTGQLAEYIPTKNPPFHTIVFPGNIFFNAKEHVEYYHDFKSHEDVDLVFHSIPLGDYKYCVIIHNKHISTIWDHPFRGNEIVKDKDEILKDFGI